MISSHSGPNVPGRHVQVFIDGEEVTDFITNIDFQIEQDWYWASSYDLNAPAKVPGEITHHLGIRVSYFPAALNSPWAFEEKT